MRAKLIFFGFLFFFIDCYLFSQKFEWARAINSDYSDNSCFAIDSKGNSFVTFQVNTSAIIDSSQNIGCCSDRGIYIAKFSSSGKYLWSKQISNRLSPLLRTKKIISIDSEDNILITGNYTLSFDFDPGPGTSIHHTSINGGMFVLKLDNDGNFLWVRTIGNATDPLPIYICINNLDEQIIIGHFCGTIDFDPGPVVIVKKCVSNSHLFILKLDRDGNFIWVNDLNLNYAYNAIGLTEFSQSITTDDQNNIFLAGGYKGTVDFDPGVSINLSKSNGEDDVYILKLNSDGNFQWVKTIGGTRIDYANDIRIDKLSNIYLIGSYSNIVDFDPGPGIFDIATSMYPTLPDASEYFLLKLNAIGDFIWTYTITNTTINGLNFDELDNIYITGYVGATIDFDPSPEVYNVIGANGSYFVLKLDGNKTFKWVSQCGNTYTWGNCINLDYDQNIYILGAFEYTDTDLCPGDSVILFKPKNYYLFNIFLQKLSQCENTTYKDTIKSCVSYTWHDGKTYTESTDTARYIIQNKAGCDSIITLDLTILKPDSTTIYHDACKNYEWKGYTFDQSGIYKYDTTNIQGCDSTVLLNLTIIKPDTASVAHTACDSYLWHNKEYDQSGTFFFDTLSTRSCDSTIVLKLTINHSSITQLSQTSCDSLTWHGQTYYESGIYQYKTQTIAGCDSIISLDLKINRSNKTVLSLSACDSYTWKGNTYTQSGTYVYQTINSAGCDSIVTLQLIITDHIERSDTINICEGDSISLFGNWISEEGEISGTFTSSAGCDSIQIYKVMMTPLPEGKLNAKICEGDSIYIIDRWISQPGQYILTKSNSNSCDSLIEVNLTSIPIIKSNETQYLCHGDTLRLFGQEVTDEALITGEFTSHEGCDSLIFVQVKILPTTMSNNEIKLCPGDSVYIANKWINSEEQVTEILTGNNGCDSTSITQINLIDEPSKPKMNIDCDSRQVNLSIEASQDWQIQWDNGDTDSQTSYQDKLNASVSLKAIEGCERQYQLILPEIPDIKLIKQPQDTVIARNSTLKIDLGLNPSEWKIRWQPSYLIDCDSCSAVTIVPDQSSEMIINLIHTSGCEYEIRFLISLEKTVLDIPNIFTPDGDGKNDHWKFMIPSGIQLVNCAVFDRWGEKVYTSSDKIDWNGQFKGKNVMSGVFVYVIEYLDEQGNKLTLSGDVTVMK